MCIVMSCPETMLLLLSTTYVVSVVLAFDFALGLRGVGITPLSHFVALKFWQDS
jgi:hypothetical protein